MGSFDRCSPVYGVDNKALEVDSDIDSSEDIRPFTPPLPNEKTPYIPQIDVDYPKSGVSRIFGDGFREIEICPHIRRKGNKVQPLGEASPSVHIISEVEDCQVEGILRDDRRDSKATPSGEDGDTLFYKKRDTRKEKDKNSDGLVLQKLVKDQEKKVEKTMEGENVSSKYGVTMSVKSGVKRTPWHHSSNGSNGEGSSKEGSGGSTRIKRKSTEETILASTSSSANSFLSAIQKTTGEGFIGEIQQRSSEPSRCSVLKDHETSSSEEVPKPIPTISQIAEGRERSSLTPISLATYNNIQKEGVPKRGNCILCFTATLTFVVTLILTIIILIAPKTLVKKEEVLPPAILDHISSANAVSRSSKKTAELSLKTDKVANGSVQYDYFSNITNYTEALPKR